MQPDNSPLSAWTPGQRIPQLDGVRGLAISMVLVVHYFTCQIKADPGTFLGVLKSITGLTWSGVDLFFVLSGFLIGGILIENRGAPNLLKVFYVRRACRIFPLYFLWLIIFIVCVQFVKDPIYGGLFRDPLPLWSYLTYLQNWVMAHEGRYGSNWMGITWSLAVEEQFYLILPFIILFTPRKWLLVLLVLLILITLRIRSLIYYHHPHVGFPAYVLLPCRWDALFIGVIGAMGIRHARVHQWLKANVWFLYAILFILSIGVIYLGVVSPGTLSYRMVRGGYTWLALFYLTFIYIVLFSPNRLLQKFIQARALIFLGMISYGVYIFHQAVTGLCHIVLLGKNEPTITDWKSGFVTLLSLGVTISLAYLSYRYFESPITRLGRRAKYQSASKETFTVGGLLPHAA